MVFFFAENSIYLQTRATIQATPAQKLALTATESANP
jgi:hypothetical protein